MCATKRQDMPHHLYRPSHGRSSCWYVRLVPPKEARDKLGAREFRRSTRTADVKKAKTIAAQLIAEQRLEWERALGHQSVVPPPRAQRLTPQLIEQICKGRQHQWMLADDLMRFEGPGYDRCQLERFGELWRATESDLKDGLAGGRASTEWDRTRIVLEHWCDENGYLIDASDPLFAKLIAAFSRADVEALGWLKQRNAGEPIPTPSIPPPLPSTLSAITDRYRTTKAKRVGESMSRRRSASGRPSLPIWVMWRSIP